MKKQNEKILGNIINKEVSRKKINNKSKFLAGMIGAMIGYKYL